jgi:DNA-binding beta-propeller fold protein YncE
LTSHGYGNIYSVNSQTDELAEFVPIPENTYTNGIDITPDDKYLFVAHNDQICRITLATKETLILEVPEGEEIGYCDGLYFYKNSLIGVALRMIGENQDQRNKRILRLYLSDDLDEVTEVQVLEEDHPLFSSATTAAIVDNVMYLNATAQFGKIDDNFQIAPWDELSDIYILKIKIE